MFAVFSPGSDIKRYYRGKMPRMALIVVILMPLLYGALYLWAFWNPFAAADKIPVALINLDKGAVVEGQNLNVGDQVVKGLVDSKQLDLHVVSEEEGNDGVAHGEYYFSITLPENFSEAVASPSGGSPVSADLVFTYNDANNYLSTVIGQDAAQQVVNQVGAQVGEQIFGVILDDVSGLVPQVQKAASGAQELSTGMQTADVGAQELATNLVTAKDGSEQLSSSLGELNVVADSVTGDILTQINKSGLTGTEIKGAAGRIATNTDLVVTALDDVSVAQANASQQLSDLRAQMEGSGDPAQIELAQQLAPVQQALETRGLGPDANDQLTTIRADAQTLSNEFSNPSSRLNGVLRFVESGQVKTDLQEVRTGTSELASGSAELSSGLVQLSDGANQLAEGTSELVSGSEQLSSGLNQGVEAIPSWSQEQQDELAKVLANPVLLTENYKNKADTFGTGFAPFFLGLALFVGGIIAWMLFTPLQARPLTQGLGSLRVILASYAPTYVIGFLQALLLYSVVVFAVGLRPVYSWGTFGFMLLIVAMFLAMIQMFNSVFGAAVGRVITLAFLMIQLTSAGGIYPVPTTSTPFQYIHWIDPMTYTVTGLRQLTVGGIDHRFWISVAVIIGLTLVFLMVSTWAARRNRQYNMDRLYPPVEV